MDKHIDIVFQEFKSADELPQEDRHLVEAAKEAVIGSYAPYSHFNVGAAVRLEGDIVVKGANQENAAYPSGLCAERTAMFAAGAQFPGRRFEALAIACFQNGELLDKPGYPCGACRQVMAQYEREAGKPLKIIVIGKEYLQVFVGVEKLMPFIFTDL